MALQIFFAVSRNGVSNLLVLLLTELMGLYAISSVVLIRKQLPQKYRSAAFSPYHIHKAKSQAEFAAGGQKHVLMSLICVCTSKNNGISSCAG